MYRLYSPSHDLDERTVSKKTTRSNWHILESLGDGVVLLALRVVLPKIFGHQSSLSFLKVLEDHAKSTAFLAEIAKYYGLHIWYAYELRAPLHWANLCEAWIGAVFTSNSMWAEASDDKEIMEWLTKIFMIRYRDLLPFVIRDWLFSENDDAAEDESESTNVTFEEVLYPIASCFANAKIVLNNRNSRFVGYFATARSKCSLEPVTGFHTVKEKAKYVVRQKLWNKQQEAISLKKPSEARGILTKSGSVSTSSSRKPNPDIAGDLFATYRIKCSAVIKSAVSLDVAIPFDERLLSLVSIYKAWYDDLQPDPSNLKTRAMLSWNLVLSL